MSQNSPELHGSSGVHSTANRQNLTRYRWSNPKIQLLHMQQGPPRNWAKPCTVVTSDGVAVGAAGDGAGQDGDGAGRFRRRHCDRQADADGVSGAAVDAQDDAAVSGGGHRRVAVLVAAHLLVALSPCGVARHRGSQNSKRDEIFFSRNSRDRYTVLSDRDGILARGGCGDDLAGARSYGNNDAEAAGFSRRSLQRGGGRVSRLLRTAGLAATTAPQRAERLGDSPSSPRGAKGGLGAR